MRNAVKAKIVVQPWIVATTKNVVKQMAPQKWIAAKTANAQKKAMMGKPVVNNYNF